MEQEKLTSSQRAKYIIKVISNENTFCMKVYKKFFSETKSPVIIKDLDCQTIKEAQIEAKMLLPKLLLEYKEERKKKKKKKKEKKSLEKQNQNLEEEKLLEKSYKDLAQLDDSPNKSTFRKKIKILKDELFLNAYKKGFSEKEAQTYIKNKIGKNWQQIMKNALNGNLDKVF